MQRLAAILPFLLGCAAPKSPPPPPAAPARPALAASRAPARPAAEPPLSITLAPHTNPPRVEVRVRAEGARLGEWLHREDVQLSELELRDESGSIGFDREPGRVRLQRQPERAVSARYVVRGAVDAQRGFRADGAALLLLPEGYAETPVRTRVRVDVSGLGAGARAASSLGTGGELVLPLSADALRRTSFVGGRLGYALFDGPEGLDRAAWLGATAFDPRQTAAEVAGFRSAARDHFASRTQTPFTLLLVSDDRRAGQFVAARRTGGVIVDVGASDPWSGGLRLATAQQVLREWIGAELALEPRDANNPLEPAWFVDGLNRSVARELLFRFGLLTPEEYRDEVEQLLALHLTSPLLRVPLAALAQHPDRAGAERAIVVRGALYATLLDARIRDKSRGAYALDDALRELFTAARARRAPLPPAAFETAIAHLLDDASAQELERRFLRGAEPIVLPAHALGRCFSAKPRTFERFSLGFTPQPDDRGTLLARAVDPKGPAHRASLRDGERIRELVYSPGRTDVRVELSVQRAERWIRLGYAPSGGSVRGQGFTRVAGVRDEDCARRGAL